MNIAFDINGTLLRQDPRETKIMTGMLKILKNAGHTIIVWSGDDIDHIVKAIRELGIEDHIDKITTKGSFSKEYIPDISFDDNPTAFSRKATIQV